MVNKREVARFDGPPFEVALWTSWDLFQKHGRTAEQVLDEYVSDALTDIGVNHRIYTGFTVILQENADPGCPHPDEPITAYEEWGDHLAGNPQWVAADCNLLLMDTGGGGCGSTGGNVAVVGVNNIDRPRSIDSAIEDPWAGNVYASMHEIGHNMSFTHSENPAIKWVSEGNIFNSTPTDGNDHEAKPNLCGEVPATRQNRTRRLWLHYHDCVADHIRTRDLGVVTVTSLDADFNPVVEERAEIDVELTNRTPVNESVEVDVIADYGSHDETIGTIQTAVPDQSFTTETLSWTPTETGDVTIRAGDASITRNVWDNGFFEIISLSASPSTGQVDQPVNLTARARNTLVSHETRTFDVTADGEAVGSLTFSVSPGGTDSETLEWVPDEPGTYQIAVDDATIDVLVEAPPSTGDIRVTGIDLPGGPPRVDEAIQVVISARNPGNSHAEENITVTAEGGMIGTVSFSLGPGETASKTLTWTPQSEGRTSIFAGDSQQITHVEPESGGGGNGDAPVDPGNPLPDLRPAVAGIATAGMGLLFVGRPETR